MAYTKIPYVAHEFVARLQFGTSIETMEFLVRQQIKLSQHMAEEHAELQMIQLALTGGTDQEEERALDKIGRMRNADEGCNDIDLPPLNMALFKVVERQAQHWPDRLNKPRAGSVGTDRLGWVCKPVRRPVRRKCRIGAETGRSSDRYSARNIFGS